MWHNKCPIIRIFDLNERMCLNLLRTSICLPTFLINLDKWLLKFNLLSITTPKSSTLSVALTWEPAMHSSTWSLFLFRYQLCRSQKIKPWPYIAWQYEKTWPSTCSSIACENSRPSLLFSQANSATTWTSCGISAMYFTIDKWKQTKRG